MLPGPVISVVACRRGRAFVAPSGQVVWLDGPQITGLANGAAVPTWTQPSGNLSQATAAKRPTYQSNALNGKAAPSFAVDDWMSGPVVAIGGPFTLFFAGAPTLAALPQYLIECGEVGSNNINYYFYINYTGGLNKLEGGFYNGTTFQGFTDPRANTSGATMVARMRYTGTVLDIWRNGVSSGTPFTTTGTPTVAGTQQLFVGTARSATGANLYNGIYGSLQIYNRSLSDAEARAVEQDLGYEWGVVIP